MGWFEGYGLVGMGFNLSIYPLKESLIQADPLPVFRYTARTRLLAALCDQFSSRILAVATAYRCR